MYHRFRGVLHIGHLARQTLMGPHSYHGTIKAPTESAASSRIAPHIEDTVLKMIL